MLFYNLGVYAYTFAIYLASAFKPKAKLWVTGRKNWRQKYSEQLKQISGKKIWVHCASMGEFEQGRPLMEFIKKNHSGYKIILTFFSPSGYEFCKDYENADAVFYLPHDSRSNAKYFLEIVDPEKVFFIKYEFWVNYLIQLKEKDIETYLISAVFKNHHPFFKWYGKVFIRSLSAFKILFVQDKNSLQLLRSINITNVEICGDTRFDRVLEIKNKFKAIPEIEKFKGNDKLIIAGSTWPGDEELILESFKKLNLPNVKLIIVPHNIDDDLLADTLSKIEKHNLSYSIFTRSIDSGSQVLVLNTMGLLSKTYHYADVSYIGGGFDSGLHNCLEAAVYRIPVTFYGNDFSKYNEAVDLINLKAAKNINTSSELIEAWSDYLTDEKLSLEISGKLRSYFENNSNITEKILKKITF
ncbi:MAG TPA: glycosyltransferase N-terminal domain-containing protein [Bacteroidia bacterium]|jgi:3-deoxy-D-manno-octulosonic-acid transferase|nr:glycosyltransferase N-terminal domain-containing protein [Bacteroidia bacterium]